jgi:hypothetical protein
MFTDRWQPGWRDCYSAYIRQLYERSGSRAMIHQLYERK